MVKTSDLAAPAAILLSLFSTTNAQGFYPKGSPVLEVDAKGYDTHIARSNHTSIVEFYAPWCGHCKNLKPAYEKAAKSLNGLAKVAAVNCDEESNKPFCGSMGIQGFPTLKIVRPGKKPGRPIVEDYNGPRESRGIVETVKDKIPNHVKRLTDKTVDEWLKESNDTAKAILFSSKGVTSALLKAVAIDYLSVVPVAQIREKEQATVEAFGITTFPTFVLLPGGDKDAIVYDGEMTKSGLKDFLTQIASPNPDPAPKAKKAKSSKSSDKKASSDASAFSKASASHEKADSADAKATQTSETLEDASNPTESPNPNVVTDDTQKPIKVPELAPIIPSLDTPESLQQACLTPKSSLCIIAILPAGETVEIASMVDYPTAVRSLSEIHHKHVQRGAKISPFYAVPDTNTEVERIRHFLGLHWEDMEVLAINAKKGWVKRFPGERWEKEVLDDWIDGIRMGEGGKKIHLPKELMFDVGAVVDGGLEKEKKKKVEQVEEEKKVDLAEADEPKQFTVEEIQELIKEMEEEKAKVNSEKAAPVHEEL